MFILQGFIFKLSEQNEDISSIETIDLSINSDVVSSYLSIRIIKRGGYVFPAGEYFSFTTSRLIEWNESSTEIIRGFPKPLVSSTIMAMGSSDGACYIFYLTPESSALKNSSYNNLRAQRYALFFCYPCEI